MCRITKKVCEQWHAKKRALERFDISFTKNDRKELIQNIQNGVYPIIYRQSKRVYHYSVNLNGKPARLVYDRKRKAPITFMTMEDTVGTAFLSNPSI